MTTPLLIPHDRFAAYLANWARCRFDLAPKAPAFVRCEPLICSEPEWFVTIEEGPHTETMWLCHSDLVTLPQMRDRFCAQCGCERGGGAEMRDTKTSTHRGTLGDVFLGGCPSCVRWVEKTRADDAAERRVA